MYSVKPVPVKKGDRLLVPRFASLILVFYFLLFSITPECLSGDNPSVKGETFPVRTQGSQSITEEMVDLIVKVCDRSLPEKVESQLLTSKTGGYYAQKGIFVRTNIKDPNILAAFNRVLKPGVRFLDLGSGDGRVVFLASLYGALSTGIEFDEDMFASGLTAREELSRSFDLSKTKLIKGDFFEADFSSFDVIYYFMGGSFEEKRLEEKLATEMKPGAVLVGYIEHKAFDRLFSAGRVGKRVTIYEKR
ncbi:MAG: class I SAM-dependent methyltransferase [Pseudomonadota bacterium]